MLRRNRRDDRVENGSGRQGAIAWKTGSSESRVVQKADRFLILIGRDHATATVDALLVFFDGHADDVRDPLDRVLLRRSPRGQSSERKHRDSAAQLGSEAHCRGNISGLNERV
jgi:hypothetical protein